MVEQPASIDITSLVKRHGATLAVDHVSLTVRRGEFFSLLGPSGAGKTSVLRMIAGFETPDEGTIRIDGRSMEAIPPNRRPVNLVFQSYALFPHLTVAENVAFGPRMQGAPRGEIASRVRLALDMVKLSSKEERLPGSAVGRGTTARGVGSCVGESAGCSLAGRTALGAGSTTPAGNAG